jgi:hypothetical protein
MDLYTRNLADALNSVKGKRGERDGRLSTEIMNNKTSFELVGNEMMFMKIYD